MANGSGYRMSLAMLLAAAVAVACGGSDDDPTAGGGPSTPVPTTAAPAGPARYQATGTVLESPAHGPELCFAVQESLPPQCGGLPLAGWDWAAVEGEEAAGGTTWGDYRVTGTYDGTTFTVTDPPVAATAGGGGFSGLSTPCSEPHNGYLDREPARATPERLDQAIALARSHDNLGGVWLDDPSQPRPDGSTRSGHLVLNVSFTGDLEDRQAELEAAWGGFVCVSRAEHTLAELQAVQAEVTASPPAGATVLSSAVSEPDNVVELTVVLATPQLQADLDARFGPGTVEVDGALRPVA